MSSDAKERILVAATQSVQAHGYSGLNFRDLAEAVGMRAASIYHNFPSKADLAAAVAKRYWEDSAKTLEALSSDPVAGLRRYPETFRGALVDNNRLCLCSFMAAEIDDLPTEVRAEVQMFAEVNITWLEKMLAAAAIAKPREREAHAQAIFASISGAQLLAKSRSDVALYDTLVKSYRKAGLIPA